jgi:hypothetical protein
MCFLSRDCRGRQQSSIDHLETVRLVDRTRYEIKEHRTRGGSALAVQEPNAATVVRNHCNQDRARRVMWLGGIGAKDQVQKQDDSSDQRELELSGSATEQGACRWRSRRLRACIA